MAHTWKPSPIQAKHIEVNRILAAAGWLIPNSRKGLAVHVYDGGEQITYRFGEGERNAMYRASRAITPDEARRIARS